MAQGVFEGGYMKQNLLKCNKCAVSNCKNWHKDKHGNNICSENDTSKCRSFLPFDSFTLPLLEHLLTEEKVQDTTDVLNSFGFKIRETGRYPFFKLVLSNRRQYR